MRFDNATRSEVCGDKGLLLAIVLASYSMIVIDNSIVITGLPAIREGLGFSAAGLSWVQNAYTLPFGGLMLLGARAGDLLGRRMMFVLGLALFTAASLAVGLAQSAGWLVASRAAQGVGAAVLAPSTLALLSTGFPEGRERNHALGWYGAVGGITASVGLVAGGVAADLISWRAGFFINVPIGLLLIWGARRHIDETVRHPGRFDIAGAILSTLGMVAVVYGLVHAAEVGWSDPLTLAALGTGIIVLAALIWHEGRVTQPILPLRLFASRERSGAYLARLLFVGAAMGFFFYVTQYLQGVRGLNPMWAGIAFFPSMLVNFLGALMAPRLTRRFGHGVVTAAAFVPSIIGMGWLGQLTPQTPFILGVALPMVLIGMGMGASLASLTISGVVGVPHEHAGSAAGVVGVAHQLGGSLGLAVMVVVFSAVGSIPAATPASELAHRVAAALSAGAFMLSVALVVVLVGIIPHQAWRWLKTTGA